MARRRKNDPLGVSDNPQVVTDPVRLEVLTNEFKRRLAVIDANYRSVVQTVGNDKDFNASLARLKRSLARKRPAKVRGERAHPEIEMIIVKHALDHAEERTGTPGADITQHDAQFGAVKAAEQLESRRGRSSNRLLRYHVEALMALLQETTGAPVRLTLVKDNVYDPQAVNTSGRVLIRFFQDIDPTIEVTTLASIVKGARRKYAGKQMRFADFFLLDGTSGSLPDRTEKLSPGYKGVVVLPFAPIYFP
jgi:hypothetical protein